MQEEILKNYFEGKVDSNELIDDLIGTSVKRGTNRISQEVISMKESFIVKVNHIIKLLNDMSEGKIDPAYLEIISFALMGSDHFILDNDEESDVIANLLQEWASPEINYELNIENIRKCLRKLESSKYKSNNCFKPRYQMLFHVPSHGTDTINFSYSGKNEYSSGTLNIEFKPAKNVNWVGSFERGKQSFDGVARHPNEKYLVVVAGGQGYIIDFFERKLIEKIGENYLKYFDNHRSV